MRTSQALDALMPRVRQSILAATVLHADRWWYLADLARHLGVTPSSLQRDLAALTRAGILRRRRDGNRTYYQADAACPFLPDLRGLLAKTAGLVDVLREALAPFAREIAVAFVFDSVAAGTEAPESDVDLMVVGSVKLADIVEALRKAERVLLRPVNASVYLPSEFRTKLAAGHPFLSQVMETEKLFVLGDTDELELIAGGAKS
jgi:uncharacterized protein